MEKDAKVINYNIRKAEYESKLEAKKEAKTASKAEKRKMDEEGAQDAMMSRTRRRNPFQNLRTLVLQLGRIRHHRAMGESLDSTH